MGKTNMAGFIKSAKRSLAKHSPEILLGIGIAGMLSTTVLAVKATPKALKMIEEKKEEENVDELTVVETVKTTWKCYVPAVITCGVSTACLIGSGSMHAKRNAALATAYKLTETALSEYRDAVVETIGEKKERAIREKVDEERIKKNPVRECDVIETGHGKTLCYDYMCGRYFTSDIDFIKRALVRISGDLLREDSVSLNDFYDEIGLPHAAMGDDFGWDIGWVGRNGIEPHITSHLTADDDPCAVIAFDPAPRPNYA